MAQHDVGTASVADLSTASVGDTVWLFDSQMNLHDEQGKYFGRGVWRLVTIDSVTRSSFIIRNEKFDRKTGVSRPRNGYSTGNLVAGEMAKLDKVWLWENQTALIRHLERCDASTLRRVANFLGWSRKEGA